METRAEQPTPDPEPAGPRTPGAALSVVVPLFDEEAGVAALAARMRAFVAEARPREIELVLVDDGSRDATAALLQEHFADLPARIERHAHNRGLTAALLTGSGVSRAPLVGWLDSDLTYDPGVLLELADAVDAGADLAVASCYHPAGAVEGVPRWRLALSGLASRLYRARTGAAIHTFTCMVRVQRREIVAWCEPARGGFLGVTESLLRALRRGHAVTERPATLRRRRRGQSKMRILRVGLGHLRLLRAWPRL